MSARWFTLLTLAFALGCAGSSFQPQFKPEQAALSPDMLARPMLTPKARDERPVAVGITQDPMRLFAWDLSAGLLWERPIIAKSAPLVVGTAIVTQEADGVVVRDLATGEVRVVADELGRLIAADAQGSDVVLSVAYDTPNPRGAVVFVSGDSVRWVQPLNLPVGTPALSNEQVVVPWATQRMSILGAADGKEQARFHLTSTVLGHAHVERGRLYIGQLGLLPVTESLLAHPEQKTEPYTPLKRELPAQPALLRDGYAPLPDPDSAMHRLQLEWRITTNAAGVPATENDTVWLRFYRQLFALDAQHDAVRWVQNFDHDLVGFAIAPGGVILADDTGLLRVLDTQGNELARRQLGRALRVLTLRPSTYLPSDGPTATAAATAPVPPSAATKVDDAGRTLRAQLFAAAALEDDRLGASRAYAAAHLAKDTAPEATASLIALCSATESPEAVRMAACRGVAERDSGGASVVEALRARASFLEGTQAPPVAPLAKAAAKMRLVKAAPLLVSHVEDPNTTPSGLAASFEALEQLAYRNAVPAIERFVRLHHAEPAGSELTPPVIAAIHALGGLKARAYRGTLEQVAQSGFTAQPVREAATQALAALSPDAAKAQPATKEEPEADAEEDEVQTDPRQYSLTEEVVRKALTPLRRELSQCVVNDPSKPRTGRLLMVVDGAGHVEGIFVTPATLSPCVEPIARRAQFPVTRLGRQRVTQLLYGPNAARTVKPKAAPKAAGAKAREKKAGAKGK